jgi:hypothetical protein
LTPQWRGVSRKLFAEKPMFEIGPPEYMTDAVEEFVRLRIAKGAAAGRD